MSGTYADVPTGVRVAGRVSATCCVAYIGLLAFLVVIAATDESSAAPGSLSAGEVATIYGVLSVIAASAAAVSAWAGPRTWPVSRLLSTGLLALGPATIVLPAAQLLLTGAIEPL